MTLTDKWTWNWAARDNNKGTLKSIKAETDESQQHEERMAMKTEFANAT